MWIARSEETVVPDPKSTEPEERRLFYVAMTRARESLMISGTSKNFESKFVGEAKIEVAKAAADCATVRGQRPRRASHSETPVSCSMSPSVRFAHPISLLQGSSTRVGRRCRFP